MLGKLLKYEYKATMYTFVPFLFAFLFLSFAFRVFKVMDTGIIALNLIAGLVNLAFVVAVIIIILFPIISGAMRFNKNLLGDQGYLMNTLPTSANMLILSKIIVSFSWIILSAISGILSLVIIFIGDDMMENIISGLKYFFGAIVDGLFEEPVMIIVAILVAVTGFLQFLLLIFSSTCIGHLSNSHKKLTAIGAFIGITIGMNIISSLVFQGVAESIKESSDIAAINTVLITTLIMNAAFSGAFYFITSRILSRKLNLE